MCKVYIWDLFGVVYVMVGCNDDYGFFEFLCWFILCGE